MKQSTWLITGASSGLGRGLARHALRRGDRVVLAARFSGPAIDAHQRIAVKLQEEHGAGEQRAYSTDFAA
ncbi:hypothetical protein [Streptomyces prunicolor]